MASSIIGESATLLSVLKEASNVARSNHSILIRGETGTGKELLAQYIHEHSGRTGELVIFNIAAFNDQIIDSELFGHKKGAFTGAISDRDGLLKQAEDGNVFMDEIGDLPPASQLKLLRIIENRSYRRIGDNSEIALKSRIIAATNAPLEENISEKRFREDLFHRFDHVLKLPPLRERREDIPLLIEDILRQEIRSMNYAPPDWYWPEHEKYLISCIAASDYHWPGNIRQLRNVIRRIIVNCIYGGDSSSFELSIKSLMAQLCQSLDDSMEKKIRRGISNYVRSHLATFSSHKTSLRSQIEAFLVEGIAEGVDLAMENKEFCPGSAKDMGEALGISTLIYQNRSRLPRKDYLSSALKNISHRDDLPKGVKELI